MSVMPSLSSPQDWRPRVPMPESCVSLRQRSVPRRRWRASPTGSQWPSSPLLSCSPVGPWIVTGDPVRALAVLVVATPCPLILAVPVAIISGVSRAARAGVLVKGGKALEALARVRSLVLDKTGTLTYGRARLVEIQAMTELPGQEIL